MSEQGEMEKVRDGVLDALGEFDAYLQAPECTESVRNQESPAADETEGRD